jgi:hypothetical protein
MYCRTNKNLDAQMMSGGLEEIRNNDDAALPACLLASSHAI